ncbi:MAG: rRNA pseudouridine synthase [Nitrospirae bacterium]|nr:rRNA pseudouridine synthase [Nitrospirota bacterium]MCL5977175.1 rRNA pseudouridine synthase [Nitrospirota bacterium]
MEQRIQKILAMAGIASRRKAEEFIIEGRVTVNGETAALGTKADPSKDHIKVDGKLITRAEPKVYLMLNKPAGVVTSLSDPEGRPTVKDFLKGIKYRVFPVGRLDYDSEGLLLMTNDGDLAHSVLHPSKKIPKIYLVKAQGIIDEAVMEKLRRGVRLEDGLTAPAKVKRIRQTGNNTWVEMIIYEGKKRQIRRMLESVCHSVIKLRRIGVDGLKLGDLKPGDIRRLTIEEIKRLKELT